MRHRRHLADTCNTQATKGAAKGQRRWSRVQQAHPAVAEAMSSGELSESFGRQITDWTRRLPEEMQAASDQILVEAALGGCGIRELQQITAPRGALSYPRFSREEFEGRFLDLMPYLELKGEGNRSMAEN